MISEGWHPRYRVEIDNNPVENSIRPTAIGKKNWLFIGDAQGSQRSVTLYTITSGPFFGLVMTVLTKRFEVGEIVALIKKPSDLVAFGQREVTFDKPVPS
ncbi:hypothetical protein GCM10023213_28660 [Prosthecobacter algae]|uniref:Transposase IS66 central domain-containing protein n=1 Tax=Prosthecobacter algae TaxID=1144682 RepID=A0ABP9PAD8_9BACT